jgi:undecaprenyl-diphosphatase
MKPLWIVASVALAAFLFVRRTKLGRIELGAGAVAAVAALAYGLGAFELPNIEHLVEDLGQALGPWTYLLVAVMAFLETGAFVGLLVPGETVILVGGLVAGQGEISIYVLIPLIWICAVAGDVTSFLLGRRLGRDFMIRHGPRVKITEERFEQVERFFDRHGGKAILLGRFIGLVRAVAPFIAGSSGMPLRRFLPYDIVGAGLWGATFALLGFIFWRSFDRVAEWAGRGAFALGTTIVVVGGSIYAYRWLRVPENRTKAHAWLHTQAERPLLRPLARVVRPVVWRGIVPLWRIVSGPLRFTGGRLTPGNLGLELTTLVAVTAVGGYAATAIALGVGDEGPTKTDTRAADMADDVGDWLVDVAEFVTHLGDTGVVIWGVLSACVLLISWRRPIEAATIASGLVLTYIGVHLMKDAIDRPRPSGGLVETSGSSLPSGHAAYALAWVAIAVAFWRGVPYFAGRAATLIVGIAVAAAVGLSRVVLDVHYFTDVLAGWGLGAAAFGVCGIAGLVVGFMRQTEGR